MSYLRFTVMVVVSTVVMFGLMYVNTYALDHALFSQTRMWMAILMGAAMGIVMMLMMWGMYASTRRNFEVLILCAVVFAAALALVRSQRTVDDVSYMEAMIPHHSIAILTSRRAHIREPRVRDLADGIIAAQQREIKQMQQLIAELRRSPPSPGSPDLPSTVALDETARSGN